jgi:outer membrane immunogenic protein
MRDRPIRDRPTGDGGEIGGTGPEPGGALELLMKWGAVIGGVAFAAIAALPASLSVSLPAQAADVAIGPRPSAPPPSTYIPAPFFWTGFYVGVAAGYGWGHAPFTGPTDSTSVSAPVKGFVAGGVTGINYQIGWAVFGVEGDFLYNSVKGSVLDSSFNNLETNVFWTASLTARFGVAFDRLLVYGKGGGAFDYDRDLVTFDKGGSSTGSINHAGWTVGGGTEYAITEHWTGRIEYDYFKFASKGVMFTGTHTGGGIVGLNLNQIKLVAAYKM